MKSKINILILLCLIIFITLISVVISSFNKNNINRLLKDENIQADILFDIYNDMLNEFSTDNLNIVLDQSAIKNILTNEEYRKENVLKLKRIEKNIEDSNRTYTISINYSKKTSTLMITITENGGSYMKANQKYKLYVKKGKINYLLEGNGLIAVE